jgi:hypothetical protein
MAHHGTRKTLVGAVLGSVATLAAVAGLTAITGTSSAAKAAGPTNTSVPKISGTVQKGKTLHADPGTWKGVDPITYSYQWQRCGRSGSGCNDISGGDHRDYTLTEADVGNTVRVVVTAQNKVGTGTAASAPTAVVAEPQSPANTAPPVVSGTPQIGQTLTVSTGNWTGPGLITYTYQWLRCDQNGGGCAAIPGAVAKTYTTTSADSGHSLRARVTAKNDNGSTAATTVPTAVIASSAGGCPIGTSGALNVTTLNAPARLTVDQMQYSPQVMTAGSHVLTARFHVSACNGRPVQGALVYATGVPYHQLRVPGEATTDATGWATISFTTLSSFPVSPKQQLLVLFVRARKPGAPLLGDISTRRLVSLPVNAS